METTHDHDHHGHHGHHDHGSGLNVAISATLHCLTGCAIGEVAGMAIGTALGLSNPATIVLAIVLAFAFGYSLTSLPLLRAGLALSAVVPIALASDTLSIATMEVVDNAIVVAIPGAMHAGLGDVLFWGSLAFALVIAGAFAVPVNAWLISRGKGHAVVHETGIHGGPPVRAVAIAAAAAFVFGSAVLTAEAFDEEQAEHGHEAAAAAEVRGLGASEGGLRLALDEAALPARGRRELGFRILDDAGSPVRSFDVAHERRMHLIVARRDLTGFWHLHPEMDAAGTWRVPIDGPSDGRYRVFADFEHEGEKRTLATDLTIGDGGHARPLPPAATTARTLDGYEVQLKTTGHLAPGTESELAFDVTRGGREVEIEPYLGAGGHLVAIRKTDLAYLHVHALPLGEGPLRFMTEFPDAGTYRLFLQFKEGGRVHTAPFTQVVHG